MLDKLRFALTISLFIAAIASSGCASGAAASDDRQKQQRRDRVAPLAEYEATLNPSDFDQDVEAVKRRHEEEQPNRSVEIPADTTKPQDELVQGFRIQIYSSPNIDEANASKASVLERMLVDSIYIVYDPPVYKVRVGDFLTRFDANSRLQDFLDMGYRDAWIVPDRIIRRGRRPE